MVYFTTGSEVDLFIFIRVISMLLAILFAFQFSIAVNDIFDIECDKVSNHSRPLVTGVLERKEYLRIGWIYLTFSLLFAFWISDNCLILTLGFILFYSVYSVPPLQLKRFFPISSLIIGIEALLAFLLGAFSLKEGAEIGSFDLRLPLFVFLIFALSSNIKDLKDIAGDRSCGIRTIPVIAGEIRGRKIIGFLVFLSYLLVPLALIETPHSSILFILSLLFGLINYLYLRRGGSREEPVFYLYFLYLFLLAAGYRLIQGL
jgi:4-hydroxybenzoate polyprenyltransferase